METLLHEIQPWVAEYGLWIVFFGMIFEGTTMILVTGVLCYLGMLSIPQTLPVAVLGAVVGDHLWYWTGRRFAPLLMDRFPALARRVEAIEPSVQRRGALLAFGSRFIYSGAILFPLALGTGRYPYGSFALYDALGATLWANVGIALGYFLGTGIERLLGRMRTLEHLLLLVIFVALGVHFYKRTVRGKMKMEDQ
ncbi:DedA family protein [Nitratifractor sp.]